MPHPTSIDAGSALRRLFTEADYTVDRLSKFGFKSTPWRGTRARSVMEHRVSGDSPLDVLARLFYMGDAVEREAAEQCVGRNAIAQMIACEMLEVEGGVASPACMIMPIGREGGLDNLLIASDTIQRIEGSGQPDSVFFVNPTTQLMSNCVIPVPGGKVLDLGTGCGALALLVASWAQSVTATDVNPRAIEYACFNAYLNGFSNISFRQSDRFGALQGETFDLIVCNPPFYLTPEPRLLFSDNAMLLDGFVRSLAQEAPRFLAPGGYFQMLCEWVEVEGEPWWKRLRGWVGDSGCDVYVIRYLHVQPEGYVRSRVQEGTPVAGESIREQIEKRLRYFQEHRVAAVHGGVVSMRRRDGKNWMRVEEVADSPTGPIGPLLVERFAIADALNSYDDQQLLETRPALSEGVTVQKELQRHNGAWQDASILLRRLNALPSTMGVDASVAEFAARLDGQATLRTRIEELATHARAPLDQVTTEAVKLIRQLANKGLVRF